MLRPAPNNAVGNVRPGNFFRLFAQSLKKVHDGLQFELVLAQEIFVVGVRIVLGHYGQHLAVLTNFRPAGVDGAILAHRVGEVIVDVPSRYVEESPLEKCRDTGIEGVLKRIHIVVTVAPKNIDSAKGRVTVLGMVPHPRNFFHQESVQAEISEARVRYIDLHGRIQVAGPDCVDVI